MPFHCDDPRTDGWAIQTLDEIHPMAMQKKKSPLVEMVPALTLLRENSGPTTEDFKDYSAENYKNGEGSPSSLPQWTTDTRLAFQQLTVEMLWWQNSFYKLRIPTEETLFQAGYKHAWLFQTPIIDAPKMLEFMLETIESDPNADVDVETGEYYESVEHVLDTARSLGCNKVLNATGLGAGALCQDNQVVGARGVLLQYDRESCVRNSDMHETEFGTMTNDAVIMATEGPWGSDEMPAYIIPRGDIIVAGGSYLEGDKETQIRPNERKRLLQNAKNMGIDTSKVHPNGEWTGFRPYRPISRLEVDTKYSTDDLRLVHSYGYGGSGWTVYAGCAKDATKLLLE
jgi:D-amino-acid oxidase